MTDKKFRNYKPNTIVEKHYKKLRSNQTVEYVTQMKKLYSKYNNKMKVWDMIMELDKIVDKSDPDITLPNSYHLFQTAEKIRNDDQPEWLQLVGLLHDLGKIMILYGTNENGISQEEQWGVVGDTFIVGCEIPNKCIYPEFNKLNPDM